MKQNKPKTVFLGTPEIAVPFLEKLAEISDVALVITAPDKPRGRGQNILPAPVKSAAQKLGIEAISPFCPSDAVEQLKQIKPDLGVVVAYGRLLKPSFLETARLGYFNVHFSLLPKYRGAAPVQRAIMNGERKTAVTFFRIDEGMDTGDIFTVKETEIADNDDAVSLFGKLAGMGVELMEKSVIGLAQGKAEFCAQEGMPSCAPMISKEESLLDFSQTARILCNKIRALAAGPRAFVVFPDISGDMRVQILKAAPAHGDCAHGRGAVSRIERGKGFVVECCDGGILIEQVKPEGKKTMSALDFINGFGLEPGDVFASIKNDGK